MDTHSHLQRIYVDNAATSWPKPEAVYQAVDDYQRRLGAPAGRSSYRVASEVEGVVRDARKRIASLLGAPHAQHIVFAANGTDALNLALHGILRPADHVVTTVVEHNSVLRPLSYLAARLDVHVTRVPCNQWGVVDPDDIRRAIRSDTRLIAMVHASNVTGALQPVTDVGEIAAAHNILFLIDAAQSAGHVPIDAQALGAHLLASPGHKGLLGPLGTGVLYVAPGVERQLHPMRQGGTGTQSDSDSQPESVPDGFESGNLNVGGIFGLRAGIEFIARSGIEKIREHEQTLTARLLAGLAEIAGVTVLGPRDPARRVGVVSICVEGYDPHEVATMLDAVHAIQVRSGLHCAPQMHAALGTITRGGAVRFSLGPFNTMEQLDLVIHAVAEIAAGSCG